jgi:hypothetical protein
MEIERIVKLIENIEQNLRILKQLIGEEKLAASPIASQNNFFAASEENEDAAIEGVFDGEKMIDYNGKSYQVSANYASKSKLVEGDPLKLYITDDGKFYYKQLGPVARKNVPGTLRSEGNHFVIDGDDEKVYNVLTASVTYYMSLFNIHAGDRLMMLLPADREAHWAVIDNIL